MKRTAIFIGMLLCGAHAFAQGIDTSVQVTNDFESSVPVLGKQSLVMNVPDTLRRFDYSFDYSGFDKPFNGAYEFSPYSVQVKPEPSLYDGRKLHLRLGAGYTLHPELDFVWSPYAGKDFAMNVFASSHGFLLSSPQKNHDLCDRIGADLRWTAPKYIVNLSLGHEGVYAAENSGRSLYNAAFASFRVRSASAGSYFFYDASVKYRYGADVIASDGVQKNHYAVLEGSVGPVIKDKYRLLVDFNVAHDALNGLLDLKRTYVCLAPHLSFLLGRFNLDAGIKMDFSSTFILSPDIRASVGLGKKTRAFAGFTGGQIFSSYSDFKAVNHHYQTFWHYNSSEETLSMVSREVMNAYAGLEGHMGSHFQYILKGGYSSYENLPLASTVIPRYYTHVKVSMPYGNLALNWKSERLFLTLEGAFHPYGLASEEKVYRPSLFDVNFKGEYNWADRYFLGLSLEGSGGMIAQGIDGGDLPEWLNLGISFEYRVNSRFSLWAKGGNLLGAEIRRNPLYAEKGQYLTLGICCKL